MYSMEELVDILNNAADAYYNGNPCMTDHKFDQLMDELKDLERSAGTLLSNSPSNKVGAAVKGDLPKYKHPYPALSLDKTKDINEFVTKFRNGIKESNDKNDNIVLMFKEDGSTLQAYYLNGKLDKLVTRGNGEEGSIVTHNAKCISGIPMKLPFNIDMVVRGEAVMSYSEFNRINADLAEDVQYANPRNLAAATLTMLDSEEASKRHLMFQAFNLVALEAHSEYLINNKDLYEYIDSIMNDTSTFSDKLRFLKGMHFNVVPYAKGPVDGLSKLVDAMTVKAQSYEYPVDGLVAAMDNDSYANKLPGTEHHPNIMRGYAFKWSDETVETILRDIEWSPSRTGLLNPVAIFDPVEIAGTTVKRASIHNVSVLSQLRLHLGDRITVYKANLIIPQIDENLDYDSHEDYTLDELHNLICYCPACGCKAEIKESAESILTAVCLNEDCPEKLIGKLAHFCSRDCMDVQGMSEETIKKLVEANLIKEYVDIFKIDQKPVISFLPGFGKQSWKKLCEGAEKAKTTNFIKFVTALGISNIGKGQIRSIYAYLYNNYHALCNLTSMSSEHEFEPFKLLVALVYNDYDFTVVSGIGSVLNYSLTDWIKANVDLNDPENAISKVYNILCFTDKFEKDSEITGSKLENKSICVTGKLIHYANRQALVEVIRQNGGNWVDAVSSKTDYLINNDVTSSSGKNKKAKELGVPIISEEDFMKMIGD